MLSPMARQKLTKRADGRYKVTVTYDDPTTGAKKRAYAYGKTQREAYAKADEVRDRLSKGAPVRDDTRTVSEWLTEWHTMALEASNRSRSTKDMYATLTGREPAQRTNRREGAQPTREVVLEALGSLPLGKVRPADVQRVMLALEKAGKSESTRRNVYAALRAAFDDAVTNGCLAANPLVKVKRPAVKKSEDIKALSVEQAQRLVKAANAPNKFRPADEVPRFGRAVRLLLLTGLRRGELLALRWQDVDLERAEATVRGSLQRQDGVLAVAPPKTVGSRRTIALSPAAVSLLKDHRTVQVAERLKAANVWCDGDFIFTTATGEPCDPRNLLRAVERAAQAAQLPTWVGCHTLRHTFATQSLLNGVPIHVVSRSLGHSSIAITADTYGHLTDDAAASAAATVADALGV